MKKLRFAIRLRAPRQRGVSMLFALCALAILTMGAVALVRSIDTASLVLGNVSLKRDALQAGSVAAEQAVTYLAANQGPQLENDQPGQGYYATAFVNLDPTGSSVETNTPNLVLVDWDDNGCAVGGVNGRPVVCLAAPMTVKVNQSNEARYVITRLCAATGPATGNLSNCVSLPVTQSGTSTTQRGAITFGVGGGRFSSPRAPGTTYRIITRTKGARGTVAFSETMVHF